MRIALIGTIALAASSMAADAQRSRAPRYQANDFAAQILEAHNRERAAVRVAPLQWDARLAADAAAYAPQLARLGRLEHSPRAGRPTQSENLFMGPAGRHTPEQMIANWASERRLFRAGVFPNVSTTGDWFDVSHYSQIIWPGTTHVGCAVARGGSHDFLVCRYSPKGNQDGQRVP